MTAEMEIWRTVGLNGNYEVSSLGRVRSQPRARTRGGIMRPRIDGQGYREVAIGGIKRRVHVLACTAFHGDPADGHEVRHLDGDSLNNLADNLAWGARYDNVHDMLGHGTQNNQAKSRCKRNHEYDSVNTYRTPEGHRICRVCRGINERARNARRRTL